MNLVLDEACEITTGKDKKDDVIVEVGRILLKGDNITLIQSVV